MNEKMVSIGFGIWYPRFLKLFELLSHIVLTMNLVDFVSGNLYQPCKQISGNSKITISGQQTKKKGRAFPVVNGRDSNAI